MVEVFWSFCEIRSIISSQIICPSFSLGCLHPDSLFVKQFIRYIFSQIIVFLKHFDVPNSLFLTTVVLPHMCITIILQRKFLFISLLIVCTKRPLKLYQWWSMEISNLHKVYNGYKIVCTIHWAFAWMFSKESVAINIKCFSHY